MNRRTFCAECRREVSYHFEHMDYMQIIRGKEYVFEITAAVCNECGEKINIHGIMDCNAKEVDEQYRAIEDIVSIEDIQNLMDIYNIGKAPLSLALGFGEITVTRYLQGQVPSKEYSDIIRKAVQSPDFMLAQLNKNRDKIGDTAYGKAVHAAEMLQKDFGGVSDKMLITISYIFEQMQEVTPLALQKILYYIQGIYSVLNDKYIFYEDCQAWAHGPVYENVYNLFRTFKYSPIEDKRFGMFKNRFKELADDEKSVINLVINSFGMYSGKVLEHITHNEEPWKDARADYLPSEKSREIIKKEAIKEYFQKISAQYDFSSVDGINRYIRENIKRTMTVAFKND